jgi:hypothetical protein
MPPEVHFSSNIALEAGKQETFRNLLQQMFPDWQRIIVDDEFATGSFSGSWVLLVCLIREEIPDLPVVVKIASTSMIQKEWHAYKEFIRGRWPRIAEIRDKPQYDEGGALGGLYYSHAGEGIDRVLTLRKYCLETPLERLVDIQQVLEKRLAKIFEYIERNSRKKPMHSLRALYDPILPVNLLIQPCSDPPSGKLSVVTPYQLPASSLRPGGYVCLEDFVVTKVDLKDDTVTLNLPRPEQDLPGDSCMIRLKYESTADVPAHFAIGQPLPGPVVGEVLKTRVAQWRDELNKVLPDQDFDINDETLHASDGTTLPNPITAIEHALGRFRNIKVFFIHGDMNLENILVYPDIGDLRLIDFAEARWDYVLHDLLRLETEVVTKLIPPALAEASLRVELIRPFYEQLHCATFHSPLLDTVRAPSPALEKAFEILKVLRRVVRDYGLVDPNDFTEYYQGLSVYLLGALKFRNLDEVPEAPVPKQLAFWAAAIIQALLESDPCEEVSDRAEGGDVERQEKMTEKGNSQPGVTITNVTGGIHNPIIAGRDIKHVNVMGGKQPVTASDEPAKVDMKRLLTDIQRTLAEITSETETLQKISTATPLYAQATALDIRAVAKKLEAGALQNTQEAEAIHKDLDRVSNTWAEIVAEAKAVAAHAGERSLAVTPIVDKLELLTEKIDQAMSLVNRSWS